MGSKRYFLVAQENEFRFLTVASDRIEMVRLSATQGKVERQVSQQEMSVEAIEENLAMAQRHGFVEVTEAEFIARQRDAADQLAVATVEAIDPEAELIDWSDLVGWAGIYFQNNPAEYLSGALRKFCVHQQSVQRRDSIMLSFQANAPTCQTQRRNLIFQRGLSIDGDLDAGDFTSELPLFVLVIGDLHVRNLILTCWAEVVVTGNVWARGTVFGYDGESGGRLKVHGNLTAAAILSGFGFPICVDGQVHGPVCWLSPDEPTLSGARAVPSELSAQQFLNLAEHTPLTEAAYYGDSNWATGVEVVNHIFEPNQAITLLRDGQQLWR